MIKPNCQFYNLLIVQHFQLFAKPVLERVLSPEIEN